MNNALTEDNKEIGIGYDSFRKMFIKQVEDPNMLDENEMKYFEYRKLNLQRTRRLEKTFIPSEELIKEIYKLDKPQTWMVITESWCGDSAQILPIIAKAALLSPKIIFEIVFRDSNSEIMDRYLTNGTRSIPKLVVFDEMGNELLQWGPRPKVAQALISNLKKEGIAPLLLYDKLHLWYGRDRGKEIEREIIELLKVK